MGDPQSHPKLWMAHLLPPESPPACEGRVRSLKNYFQFCQRMADPAMAGFPASSYRHTPQVSGVWCTGCTGSDDCTVLEICSAPIFWQSGPIAITHFLLSRVAGNTCRDPALSAGVLHRDDFSLACLTFFPKSHEGSRRIRGYARAANNSTFRYLSLRRNLTNCNTKYKVYNRNIMKAKTRYTYCICLQYCVNMPVSKSVNQLPVIDLEDIGHGRLPHCRHYIEFYASRVSINKVYPGEIVEIK